MQMAEEDHVLGIGINPVGVWQIDALIREEIAAGHEVFADALDIKDRELRAQEIADDILL